MYYIRVETDFVYPGDEAVYAGPYFFRERNARENWSGRFKQAFDQMNRSLAGDKGCRMTAVYCYGGQPGEAEVMTAPRPEGVVENLQHMWEHDVIRPKTA
jgi:hypothetical protein